MNFFIQTLVLKGFPVKQASAQYQKVRNMSPEDFAQWREDMRWSIFKHHYEHNTVYRNWVNTFPDVDLNRWDTIPILTKKDLQLPVDQRLTEGYAVKEVHLHNTSGSSGHPFFFAKDKFCHAMTWMSNIDRYGWHGITYGESLQARFYGIPLTFPKNIKESIKDSISARVRFPVFDLSDPILESFLEKFYQYKFDYINGYTSSLVLFAKYVISQGIVLKEICPTLKVTFPTSEVLNDLDRATLETGFGVPVVNEYGAAELDLIAFEDQDFDWVVNDDNLWVEIVDENNRPLPNGEEGRIIITALYNKAMPFVRYELGDIGSLKVDKKGKYQVLKTLQGRTNDIAILPSGKKSPGLTFYYISKSLLEGGGGMKEFIIKQVGTDQFHFEYVAAAELTSEQKQQVQDAMNLYLEPGLTASFERKVQIERTKAGKLKHFTGLTYSL